MVRNQLRIGEKCMNCETKMMLRSMLPAIISGLIVGLYGISEGGALFGIIIGAVMMFAMGCICYAMNR